MTTPNVSAEVDAVHQFPAPSARISLSDVEAAHQFPAPPARITLIAIPLIYAGMGIALGTTAGLALAVLGTPMGVSAALNQSTPTASDSSAMSTSPGAQPDTNENSPPAPVVQVAYHSDSPVPQPGANALRTNSAPQLERTHATRFTPASRTRTSSRKKKLLIGSVRVHRHRARHINQPAQSELATAPEAVPEQLGFGQQNFGEVTKPSSVYTEGDFTVADYDAKGGTIESSDGRTFVVGVTIAASDTNSWGDYHSNVHYRCSQSGSCTLSGPGVVAPNAKLI
jgi:hypothetical protein